MARKCTKIMDDMFYYFFLSYDPLLYFKIIPSTLRRAHRPPQSPEAKESPKATSPLQELEVGSHRLLYLLVLFAFLFDFGSQKMYG